MEKENKELLKQIRDCQITENRRTLKIKTKNDKSCI